MGIIRLNTEKYKADMHITNFFVQTRKSTKTFTKIYTFKKGAVKISSVTPHQTAKYIYALWWGVKQKLFGEYVNEKQQQGEKNLLHIKKRHIQKQTL